MAVAIYFLCTLTSALCAFLLFRAYRRNPLHLLFWSGWCFVMTTVTNFLVILDRLVFPNIDFLGWRLSSQLVALSLLLFGLIWREE
jgi:hypothetical protein